MVHGSGPWSTSVVHGPGPSPWTWGPRFVVSPSLACKHVNQTLNNVARVCKCCFKQQFGNFSKIVHISSQNLFKPSQRKQSFGIVLSDLCDKVGLPLKNSEYHSTKICNTCSRKILKVHELVTELKSSVTCI